jgi:hypothetical protein
VISIGIFGEDLNSGCSTLNRTSFTRPVPLSLLLKLMLMVSIAKKPFARGQIYRIQLTRSGGRMSQGKMSSIENELWRRFARMFHVEHSGGGSNRCVAVIARVRKFETWESATNGGTSMIEMFHVEHRRNQKKSSVRTVFHVKHLATGEGF